jgi:hypothetical protein
MLLWDLGECLTGLTWFFPSESDVTAATSTDDAEAARERAKKVRADAVVDVYPTRACEEFVAFPAGARHVQR